MVKKRVKNALKSTKKSKKMVRSSSRKVKLVFKRLSFFIILFVAFFVLQGVAGDSTKNIFLFLSVIFGFISLALVMVLLLLGIMKLLKK